MISLEGPVVAAFGDLVADKMGLRWEADRMVELRNVMEERMRATRTDSPSQYLALVAGGSEELLHLAERLSVTETFFFRQAEHFRALSEVLGHRAAPRILSLACASGEEPYSIAMTLAEAGIDAEIHAIDLNRRVLRRAEAGQYSGWSLRNTPPDVVARYLQKQGSDYVLQEAVRRKVRFALGNLLDPHASFWQQDAWDVIFCRNVLMYFRADALLAVIGRITRALAPGGHLFLGHAETLRGLTDDYHLVHSHDCFYYRKRGAPEVQSVPMTSPPVQADEDWAGAIQQAAARIEHLLSASRPAPPAWDLEAVWSLIRQERPQEALQVLRRLPEAARASHEVQLLEAVLLTNHGPFEEARTACQELLRQDELNAGAHYLMALCEERSGDASRAREHDEKAIHLEATFAMPHLHLGLLAGRAGDRQRACEALEQALALLPREDPLRLLLFGGGFPRDAMVELCRTQLRGLRGQP